MTSSSPNLSSIITHHRLDSATNFRKGQLGVNAVTITVFAFSTFGVFALLYVVGYPIRVFIERIANQHLWVASPLYGIWPILTVGWIASASDNPGVMPYYRVLAACSALLTLFLITRCVLRKGFAKGKAQLRHSRALQKGLWVASALFAFYVLIFHAYMSLPYVTPISIKNYDAPFVTAVSEFLRFYGFNDFGNLLTMHSGRRAQTDVTGTFLLLSYAPSVVGTDVWRLYAQTMLLSLMLGAYQLAILLRHIFGLRWKVVTGVAIIASVTPITFFAFSNNYLSQFLGIALFYGFLTAFARLNKTGKSFIAVVTSTGLLGGSLWYVYPYLTVVSPILAACIVVLRNRFLKRNNLPEFRSFRFQIAHYIRVLFGIALAIGTSVIAALILATGRAPDGLNQLRVLQGAPAGWTLPRIWPYEMMGFSSTFLSIQTGRTFAGIASYVILITLTLFAIRTRTGRMASLFIVFVLASHSLIEATNPGSYQQWKWASAFAPLLVAGVIAAVSTVVDKLTPTRIGHLIVTTIIGALAIVIIFNDFRMVATSLNLNNQSSFIAPDLAALDQNNAFDELNCVNTKVSAWESMWFSGFHPKTKQNPGAFWNYYGIQSDINCWTLERLDNATDPEFIIEKRSLNSSYQLVKRRSTHQAQLRLTHWENKQNSDLYEWKVVATNTGDIAWHSRLDGKINSVSLFAYGVAEEARSQWLLKQDLPSGIYVLPGESYEFTGSLRLPKETLMKPQFDLLYEDREPFALQSRDANAPVPTRK